MLIRFQGGKGQGGEEGCVGAKGLRGLSQGGQPYLGGDNPTSNFRGMFQSVGNPNPVSESHKNGEFTTLQLVKLP